MNKGKIKISLVISLFSILLLTDCYFFVGRNTPRKAINNLPIVKVDQDYNFCCETIDGFTPSRYEIQAGEGFILDLSDYEIQILPQYRELNVRFPNRIEITQKGDYNPYTLGFTYNYYYLEMKANENLYILSSQTLLSEDDIRPFTGLQAGETLSVSIVFFDENGRTTGMKMHYPLWRAGIDVR